MIDYASLEKLLSKNIRNELEELLKNTPKSFNDEAKLVSIKKGKTFIQSDTTVNTLYILVKGQVKAVDYRIDEIIYDYTWFEPIEILGAMEFYMGKETYITTLVTLTDCIMISFSNEIFRKWVEKDTDTMLNLINVMLNRLNDQSKKERTFMFLSAKERMMYLFVQIYQKYNQTDVCEVKLTQDELANRCGINLRTATRTIHSLCEENMITKKNRKLYISYSQYKHMEEKLNEIIY